ncbi:hypothetical protein CO661_12040 [Sinorhizobium fredii]|uniref:Uncharacterized protein n=1 Tax=Rhizobium fredii TaxID=380 RepID=A0A2A6LYK4_RHIFR|nr:hypothetical protein [Sinorhizobium fredii]PDT47465.1 hypothetical protein CO661_12040 [Sinorhizobium fredii]
MASSDALQKIHDAARWLAEQAEARPNVINLLRQKFDITAVQAAQACTMANQYRSSGGHSG